MALQVASYTCPFGTLPNTYWRWDSLAINVPKGEATVTLKGYVDEAAYNSAAKEIGERTVKATGEAFAQIGAILEGVVSQQPLSEVIYNFAKENDEFFAGAVDA